MSTTSTAAEPTPDYAVNAAADLLEPLERYYNAMEERPSFNKFAFTVAEWFQVWMYDALETDTPLRDA